MSRRGETPTPTPSDTLYYYTTLRLGVNSEGKLIIWNEKFLRLTDDGGVRADWQPMINLLDDQQAYYNSVGGIAPDSATNTSVTIGDETWDFSNDNLISPLPPSYVP